MTDITSAQLLAHEANVARYRRILATKLTDLERSFIMKRLAEEKLGLRRCQDAISQPSNQNTRTAA